MLQKNSWKDYFAVSKKDRNAFVITMVIIGAVIAAPFLFNRNKKGTGISGADSALAQIPAGKDFFAEEEVDAAGISEEKLFTFDPNTLDLEGWLSLGLSRKTANTIINYTSKGGYFSEPENIRKIWGLKKEEADKLIPYIRIQNKKTVRNNFSSDYEKRKVAAIDINQADAAEFKALPGIGDVLSERIVKYRNSIKAFATIEDIKKVYGISDATFETIRPYLKISNQKVVMPTTLRNTDEHTVSATTTVKAVNINTATEKDMTAVGIPRNVARSIVVYREQNGNYNRVEEIKKIIFINADIYKNVAPLMTVE